MKSLTEIYNQIREQVLPNTQTKGNANMQGIRGDTKSASVGSVPSVPKEKQAAHISGNFRAGQAATRTNPSSTPTKNAIPNAGRPVISAQAKERAEAIVKKRNTGSPHAVAKTPAERAANYGHSTGSKFSQGPAKNASDAATKRQIDKPKASPGKLGALAKAKDIVKTQQAQKAYASGDASAAKDAGYNNPGKSYPKKGTAQAATPPAKPAAKDQSRVPAEKPAEKEQSFAQAFAAARKKAGGGGGVFTYKGKKYQTNVKGEKYLKQSKLKSVDEAVDHTKLYKKIRDIIGESDEHLDHDSLGAKNKPKKSIFKSTLGALEKRKWSGNQDRNPSSYTVSKSLVAEKSTDTGESEDEITVNPKEKAKANNNTINNSSSTTSNIQ